MAGKIHIGTSGWNYDHWQGSFYPEDVKSDRWLEYYCQQFGSVEINNTFYQLPEKRSFEKWYDTVPKNFIFTVKGSRYITHMKKLKDPEESLDKFLKKCDLLKDKLGSILFQLPPRWKINTERLADFLKALPDKYRYAFEFRDSSWWHKDTYQLLREHRAAFCIFELAGRTTPKEITSDLIYIRLHGPEAAYEGSYDNRTLSGWAGALMAWRSKGHDIYFFFDNDQNGYAAKNALALKKMVS